MLTWKSEETLEPAIGYFYLGARDTGILHNFAKK